MSETANEEKTSEPKQTPGLELAEAGMTTYEVGSLVFKVLHLVMLFAILMALDPNCAKVVS